MIAALYVQTNGVYFGLDGVDPWDEPRNAILYDGPHPVVAHAFGASSLPCLEWRHASAPTAVVSTCTRTPEGFTRGGNRMSKRLASRTPEAFRDLLLSIARSVTR